ncbi:hypothetical protein BGX26_008929, partial [Mortierella sp. AD094]
DGDWTEHSYASAFKVFVDMKQDKAESPPSAAIGSGAGHSDALVTPPSYAVLQERVMTFMRAFNVSKTEAYKARVAKRFESSPLFHQVKIATERRELNICPSPTMLTLPNSHTPFLLVADRAAAAGAGLDTNAEPKPINPFDTLDKPDPDRSQQYRPRYSPKIRYEPSEEQPPPAVSMQYMLKPWKVPPEKPSLPEPTKKPTAAIKTEINDDNRFGRKEMMDALS